MANRAHYSSLRNCKRSQPTTGLQLPASWMKSRKQANPINVDKSTHALEKKRSFQIETGRAAGTLRSAQLWESSRPDFTKLGWVECWRKPERFWNLRWWTPEQWARIIPGYIGCDNLSFRRAMSRLSCGKEWCKRWRDWGTLLCLTRSHLHACSHFYQLYIKRQ